MKDDYITLSEKHGVNPSVLHCFICGKETGVALLGKLKDDAEAPRDMTNPNEFCDECKAQLDAGNKFVLEVEEETQTDSPSRTGSYVCVKGTALPDIKSSISYCPRVIFQKMFGEFLK